MIVFLCLKLCYSGYLTVAVSKIAGFKTSRFSLYLKCSVVYKARFKGTGYIS